jgi:colicin import membrane protein
MQGGFIQLHATEWFGASKIPWSPNPPFTQAAEIPLYPENPSTVQTLEHANLSSHVKSTTTLRCYSLEEEVLALTKEWYAAKGKKMPRAEEAACLEMIEKEKAEQLKPIEQTEASTGSKADYGTKQYWAEYWAKKKAEGYVSKADQKKKDAEAKAVAKAEAAAAKEKAKAEAVAAKAAAKATKVPKSKVSSLTQTMSALTLN